MSTEIAKIDDQEVEQPKEVFPEDGLSDKELVRMLREELGKSQATVDSNFRERQRQTVINELVKERNAARDRVTASTLDVSANVIEKILHVFDRDGLLDQKSFDAVVDGLDAAIAESGGRMRFDAADEDDAAANEAQAQSSAKLREVFTKYHKIIKEGPQAPQSLADQMKALPDSVEAETTNIDTVSELTWEQMVANL